MEHSVSKMERAFDELLRREDYLVTQANELARSFGNLSALEHKVLDYAFSFVQRNDEPDKVYQANIIDIIRHLGLTRSGRNYTIISKAFRSLDYKTSLTISQTEADGKRSILITHLFDHVKIVEDGRIEFRFSRDVEPYVFQLKKRFYSFRLSELALVRSKYTLIMLKLWNANANGWRNYDEPGSLPPNAKITGSLDEWESWFLNTDNDGVTTHWTAGRFRQKVLDVALKELATLYPRVSIDLEVQSYKRKTTGYTVTFTHTDPHLAEFD